MGDGRETRPQIRLANHRPQGGLLQRQECPPGQQKQGPFKLHQPGSISAAPNFSAGQQTLRQRSRWTHWRISTGNINANPTKLIFKPGAIRHRAPMVHSARSQPFIKVNM